MSSTSPVTGQKIKFKHGTYSSYVTLKNQNSIDANAFYYCTDTNQFFLGNIEYTRPVKTGEGAPTSQTASTEPMGSLYYDSTNQVLYSNLSGSWASIANNINIPVMTGATSSTNGSSGLVPAPTTDDYLNKFLKGDGTWAEPQVTVINKINSSSISLNDFRHDLSSSRKIVYHYFVKNSSSSTSFYNCPTSLVDGKWWVKTQEIDGGDITQTMWHLNDSPLSHLIYFRTAKYDASSGLGVTWSGWTQIATKATSYTIGHVPVFGVTGELTSSDYTIRKSVPADAVFTDTTYSAATQSTDGLMSSTDKTKLDSITPANLLTNSDIIICTQSEYDNMQTRTGLLYFIKEDTT